EAAASELEQLGGIALPALRAAREQKDPEVRSRAAALIEKIEGTLLTQPTMLRLDSEDQPLPEVLKDLSEQSGIRLTLLPQNAAEWKTRGVTLHEPNRLPFWKAMDRLCEASRLQYNAGINGFPYGRDPVFPLFEGGTRPSAPTFDSGPFRLTVLGLHFQRD